MSSYRYEGAPLRVTALSTEGGITFTNPSGSDSDHTATITKATDEKVLVITGHLVVNGELGSTGDFLSPSNISARYIETIPAIVKITEVFEATAPAIIAAGDNLLLHSNDPDAVVFAEAPWLESGERHIYFPVALDESDLIVDRWYDAPFTGYYRINYTVRATDLTTQAGIIPHITRDTVIIYPISDADHTFYIPNDAITMRSMGTWSSVVAMQQHDELRFYSKFSTNILYRELVIEYIGRQS